MPITLLQARQFLEVRLGGWAALAGLSLELVLENVDLGVAIGLAADAVGGAVADLTNPTEEELAGVPDARRRALLDVAELEALRSIRGNWTKVTAKVDVLQKNWSDLLKFLMDTIAAKEKQVKADHGIGGEAEDAATVTPTIQLGRIVWGRQRCRADL